MRAVDPTEQSYKRSLARISQRKLQLRKASFLPRRRVPIVPGGFGLHPICTLLIYRIANSALADFQLYRVTELDMQRPYMEFRISVRFIQGDRRGLAWPAQER